VGEKMPEERTCLKHSHKKSICSTYPFILHTLRWQIFLQENEARGIFQQLILALDYCHRMGVANRDIKLENVLLGGDKNNPIIKLTDFGFSKSDLDSIPTTICGTVGYMGVS